MAPGTGLTEVEQLSSGWYTATPGGWCTEAVPETVTVGDPTKSAGEIVRFAAEGTHPEVPGAVTAQGGTATVTFSSQVRLSSTLSPACTPDS